MNKPLLISRGGPLAAAIAACSPAEALHRFGRCDDGDALIIFEPQQMRTAGFEKPFSRLIQSP